MGFNCGIVGLPNVGKSTLFNALTATAAAEAANYPFCTIEPNVGRVAVPDQRLHDAATIAKSAKIIPTQLEFVDIAGLVKGASRGEGLGNQFLGNIRQTDAIVHVLRCFEGDVTHVEGRVDPIADAEIIETELMLADLESLEKKYAGVEKRARTGDKESKEMVAVIEPLLNALREGKPARFVDLPDNETTRKIYETLHLLTAKPVLYVANVEESSAATGNEWSEKVKAMAEKNRGGFVVISAAIESEISQLKDEAEKKDFLATMDLDEPGLAKIIRAGYGLLDLITYFTVGPKEARAWTITKGTKAPQAAGVIHTDFEKGFIRAETIGYDDFVTHQGEVGAKEAGKMRLEGKEYIVKDGDIMHFRFNV